MSHENIFYEIYIFKRNGCFCANSKECGVHMDFGHLFSHHHLSIYFPDQRRKTVTLHLINLFLWVSCHGIPFQSALPQNVVKSQHDKRS